MNIHVTATGADRKRAHNKRQHALGLHRRDAGIKFGVASHGAIAPNLRIARVDNFDLANAPAGARLVPFSELAEGECQWGFADGDANLFCGLPVDPAAKGTKLYKRYCTCHVKAATGRTVVR